jgi:hypothetical protein
VLGIAGIHSWMDRISIVLCLAVLATAVSTALSPSIARGWEWRREPVDFRIALALDRASVFTDALARAATAAYPYGSSTNPAADDFLRKPPNDFDLVLSGTGTLVQFGNGSALSGASTAVSWRPGFGGTLTAIYARTDSRGVESSQGDHFALHSDEITLRYSRLVVDAVSLGIGGKLTSSTMGLNDVFFDSPRRITTEALGFEGQAGVVARVHAHWLLGLFGTVGHSRSETHVTAFLPPPPFGPDIQRVTAKDEVWSVNVKGGVGWNPADWFGFFADLQYLQFIGRQQAAEVGRLFAGVEVFPVKSLALRAGGIVDTQGQVSASTGLGIYLSKMLQGELAYSYNTFPEVRREFGPAHVFSASLIVVY